MVNDIVTLMKERHSVRKYSDRKIDEHIRNDLKKCVNDCNHISGLNFNICFDEPEAFNTPIAHYGKFDNVNNYIALIGKNSPDFQEKCGYYGEQIVLKAQDLGLNTCWVALTFSKKNIPCTLKEDEKLAAVIAFGYGAESGSAHKSKSIDKVMHADMDEEWFIRGVEAALLAPTAVNQQKFFFEKKKNYVKARAGLGFYTKLDLGIVKYHFEIAAGKENFTWI